MSPARLLATDGPLRGRLIAPLRIVMLAMIFLVGYQVWSGNQPAIHSAETTSRDYSAILEARLEVTLRRTGASLWDLAHTIPVAALSQLSALMVSFQFTAPMISRRSCAGQWSKARSTHRCRWAI